jgi:Uma2 family endonuclease
MSIQEKLYTTADLANILDDDRRYELDEGELIVMPPPQLEHAAVVNWLAYLITGFVFTNKLGIVWSETGYQLRENPDTVRAPDVSFTSKERLKPRSGTYQKIAPDLAIEVASPGNTASDMNKKVSQYFEAGVRLVWLLYIATRQIYVYTSPTTVKILGIEDTLDGGEVLPGFSVTVREIFSVLEGLDL